jgi:hypothetical protein
VSNGLSLRLLRDNASLVRPAFVEFDLAAMMDGQVYADFRLLWLLCHQSRVAAERPENCLLEAWARLGREQGVRLLALLRQGVEKALGHLGQGFLDPKNGPLRERLRGGSLHKQDFYRQLLRLVYRLIFLFAAEDRQLLLDPHAPPEAHDRYKRYYSTARLRRLAARQHGTAHGDLWQLLRLVMTWLGSNTGCPALGLPALGSFLWSQEALPDLMACHLENRALLSALRALAYAPAPLGLGLLPVDYRSLGTEELGSLYESLLELRPVVSVDAAHFELRTDAGHDRKTTGSYYTPASLVRCLLDTALQPVLDAACARGSTAVERQAAILALRVCDPACGSGHFLLAAAQRLAKRLAEVRCGDPEPPPSEHQRALRDVVTHCLYGVDINEMAVELCKVSLWLEALVPGKPLAFLDQRIRCGNSLLGATLALLHTGLPDAAFVLFPGDDRATVRALYTIPIQLTHGSGCRWAMEIDTSGTWSKRR